MTTVNERTRPAQLIADKVRYRTMMGQRTGRVEEQEKLGKISDIRKTLKLDIERARYVTQAYKENDSDPISLRRAKAMDKYLSNMSLFISEYDLIAGSSSRTPDHVISYPELYSRWVDKAIEMGYRDMITDEEREELHEINKFWFEKSVQGKERIYLAEEDRPYWSYMNQGVFVWVHGAHSGQVPNYEKVFQVGLKGIKQEAQDKLDSILVDREFIRDDPVEFIRAKAFLEAVIISIDAAVKWANRFGDLAQSMADVATDDKRKKELQRMADACHWVPENPPRSFFEVVQSWFLLFLLVRVLDIQTSGIGDRVDYLWYPFYKKDKQEGKITPEEAQEIIEFTWLKFTDLADFNAPIMGSGAHTTPRYITIGGQDHYGRDATNDLTYIIMDSVKSLGLVEPMMVVRLHRNTPDEFLYRFTDIMREDAGHYGIFNDEFMVPWLVSKGLPVEDARNWCVEGCMRWAVVGKPMGHRGIAGVGFALPKCLEYALNGGKDDKFFNGNQIGPKTQDPTTFQSIDEVIAAYMEHVKFFTEKIVIFSNLTDATEDEWLPQPFNSALLDGCIENAKDVRHIHYWHKTNMQPVGQTSVVNALVAMKKLIFEDKTVTMEQLLQALKDNWEGHEELRQKFLDAPKFGNDDDDVDLFAREVHIKTCEATHQFKTIYGFNVQSDGSGSASYFSFSGLTGATPDGRRDREVFTDGTVSPAPNTDVKGPTAVLKSVAKIDPLLTFNHLFNQRWYAEFLEGDNKSKFVAYLKTFIDLGIHHIQGNVVDDKTLIDAQEHPENYERLVVRIAGFSAYFTDMHKEVQDQVIARTKQKL